MISTVIKCVLHFLKKTGKKKLHIVSFVIKENIEILFFRFRDRRGESQNMKYQMKYNTDQNLMQLKRQFNGN